MNLFIYLILTTKNTLLRKLEYCVREMEFQPVHGTTVLCFPLCPQGHSKGIMVYAQSILKGLETITS